MKYDTELVVLGVLLALLAAALVAAGVGLAEADAEHPYNGSDGNVSQDDWADNRTEVDPRNVSHYVSRVQTFMVGDADGDPGAGPLLTGLLVGAMSLAMLGSSRAGLAASGTVGVLATASLSQSAGLLPSWAFGVAMMAIGLLGGIVFIRMVR